MDDYLNLFREMISLRSLTEHTAKSYSTYIKTYLFYLSEILHKTPEEVSWSDLREFVRWLQREKSLSDRTINHCISQLRFFTLYVLHKPWDPTQLPMRKFDSYLPLYLNYIRKINCYHVFALFRNFFDYIFISQFSHLSIPGKSTFFSVPGNMFLRPGACWRSMMKVMMTVRKPSSGPYSRKAGRMKAAGIRTAPKGR